MEHFLVVRDCGNQTHSIGCRFNVLIFQSPIAAPVNSCTLHKMHLGGAILDLII